MIKYKTQVGLKVLNKEARELRNALKSNLKGMHCRKCKKDTIISFIDDGYGHLKPSIKVCCSEFEQRIHKQILSK